MKSLQNQLETTGCLHSGLYAQMEDAAYTRWLEKPVLSRREIDLAKNFDAIRMVGLGSLGLSSALSRRNNPALTLSYRAKQPVQHPMGRAYSTAEVFVPIDHEDLGEYNRLSIWVYVQSKVNATNHMALYLRNAGPQVMPVPGRFEGYHTETIPSGVWTRVLWEIPDVNRNDVRAISFSLQASGTSYPGDCHITCYFDELTLEKVETDQDKGFDLRENAIAYCHSGYRANLPKQALVQHLNGPFVLKNKDGNVVFTGEGKKAEEGFTLLDFSPFNVEGYYTLHVGDLSTKPFPIGSQAYLACAWKTLNFFFVERCGFTVPNVHTQCHLDVMSLHPDGRKKSVAGGWHDAGDLTQDGRNTMECTLAMLELYQQAQRTQPQLAMRSLEEGRWGLDWLMASRWGDGYRHCGRIIGFWTNNIIGDTDDIETLAENRPYDNLLVARVFAKAAILLQKTDAMYADLCLAYAKEDYAFGIESMHKAPGQSFSFATQIQLNGQAALSGVELYKATGDEQYLALAARFAKIIMNCQCISPPENFTVPLYGFFYETEEKKRIQAYFHRSYEHVAVQALCELMGVAPSHIDAPLWEKSIMAYGQYLKDISNFTPYGLCASYIYEVDNADFSNIYHEGNRSAGEPTMEEYNAQVKNGIKIGEKHYLRIFPVAYQFRGFHAPLMGKALAALEIDKALGDAQLRALGVKQIEWMLGHNPFALSSVYGEGYDFHPLYTGMQPQIVGAVPVGFETFKNEDIPYYPIQNLPTYKEIWVHTTCRLMKFIAYLGIE